tara:strand:+ start:237 stop:1262 length:1026 start_codon:yes stop_codon:yes gene_type:complete
MSNILANNINPRSGNKITIGNVNTTVAIAGTATYEDVTSIDSVGIITARSGINVTGGQLNVGSNIKIGNAGVITATSFSGDGSALTGIAGTANVSTNTLNVIGVSTLSSGVFLPEDQELKLGGSAADPDFKIYNDSTSSYINSTQAGAYLRITSAGGMVMQVGGNENMLFAAQNGKVSLYYDGSEKIETTSTGVEVTGNITTTLDLNSRYLYAKDIFLEDVSPELRFTDSDENPDYRIRLNAGLLGIRDITNNVDKMVFSTAGVNIPVSNVGVQTNFPTSSTLVGAASSLIGLYIGDGHMLFSDNLSRSGGYYIPSGLNALNAGPVTLGSTMTLDGVWVIV